MFYIERMLLRPGNVFICVANNSRLNPLTFFYVSGWLSSTPNSSNALLETPRPLCVFLYVVSPRVFIYCVFFMLSLSNVSLPFRLPASSLFLLPTL